jgi:hypothetical protein
MTDFRRSAALMAARLRAFRELDQDLKDEGTNPIDLIGCLLWEPADQAALDAYEAECLEHSGAVPLGLEVSA